MSTRHVTANRKLFHIEDVKKYLILTHAETLETSLIESTAFIGGAGWHADTITALQLCRTVGGGVAGAGDPDALHLGVTSEVLGTHALLPVSGDAAVGIETTSSGAGAGVNTLTIVTHLISLAVSVCCTRT